MGARNIASRGASVHTVRASAGSSVFQSQEATACFTSIQPSMQGEDIAGNMERLLEDLRCSTSPDLRTLRRLAKCVNDAAVAARADVEPGSQSVVQEIDLDQIHSSAGVSAAGMCWDLLAGCTCVNKFEETSLSQMHPVVAVSFIMSILYVSFNFVYAPAAHITLLSPESCVFHAAFMLALVCYHQACVTDPGRIPEDWEGEPDGLPLFAQTALNQDGEGSTGSSSSTSVGLAISATVRSGFNPHERKKDRDRYRYCNKEMKFKPDRAHYCSQMSRNVLRMDHYCPWLVNCVGYYNHKPFFLFLFYTALATNLTGVEILGALIHGGHTGMGTFMLYQGAFLSSLLSALITPFFGFHCWMMGNNLTTIEYCEKRTHERCPSGARPVVYDIGVWNNVRSVLGEHCYEWLLPIGTPRGNGLDFDIAPDEPVESKELTLTSYLPGPLCGTADALCEMALDFHDLLNGVPSTQNH